MDGNRFPNVLVVDDDTGHCLVLNEIFERAGYRVRCAYDGQEALATLLEWPADLVITELLMPRMGGMELLQSVRALNPRIAVVVLTAFGDWRTYVDAMNNGAVNYLSKPVPPDAILGVARHALFQRGIRAPSAHGPSGNARTEREAA